MAYREIAEKLKTPPGATDRYKALDAYDRVLSGTFYEDIGIAFENETDASKAYVPMAERRPNIRYNAALMVTRRSQAELWGDEQLPAWQCILNRKGERDEAKEQLLEFITSQCDLDLVMAEAFEVGQSGSVAIVVRKRDDGLPDFDIIEGKFGAPVFDANNQQRLTLFAQVYPVNGSDLLKAMTPLERAADEAKSPDERIQVSETYWFRIEFDAKEERRFYPLKSNDYEHLGQLKEGTNERIEWRVDSNQVYPHGFEMVPVVWIRNLVGRRRAVDGPCTFAPIVDNIVAIDYTLSQAHRGLKYNGDPMLFIRRGEMDMGGGRRPAGDADGQAVRSGDGKLARTGAQVLSEGPGGDAKILEITGSSIAEMREFSMQLREWSLEIVGGNKASAENEKGPSSGRALERLDKPMRLLVKFQRKAYGDLGSVPLMRILLSGLQHEAIAITDVAPTECDPLMRMRQVWPKDDLSDGQDMLYRAQALQTFAGAPFATAPVPLVGLEALQQKAANDLGFQDPNAVTAGLDKSVPKPVEPSPDGGGKDNPQGGNS